MDDPLSALDARVGRAVFQNVISGALDGKTRILVTHALHFLPLVDRILVMDHGKIAEDGTYDELVQQGGAFSRLVKQFGAQDDTEAEKEKDESVLEAAEITKKRRHAVAGGQQMQVEERNKGSVSGKGKRKELARCLFLTYSSLRAVLPLRPWEYSDTYAGALGYIYARSTGYEWILVCLTHSTRNIAHHLLNCRLVYWQEDEWHLSQRTYVRNSELDDRC
jgi:ABC-type proline/glycine betaine transport system ATPase subunit